MLTLLVAIEWAERHLVVPDGDDAGKPWRFSDSQLAFVARHYMVQPNARFGQRAPAFVHRRSQLIRGQKSGKSPLAAAFVCLEAVGPALFAGFAQAGDAYVCADHGCNCGWVYIYGDGEPMGRPWPTPNIQIAATTEDQTANTYDALRPMINDGPLADLIPKTGEDIIRIPGGGEIAPVTSKASSRLGQRITFAVLDETGIWTKKNSGHSLASTMRRGLAGMGGRAIETTNAYDPAEDSVAQRTYESDATDILRDFDQPPTNLDWADLDDRRKIIEYNYRDSPWVEVDAILAEASEISERDPAQAERFFGNRVVAGTGAWMNMPAWMSRQADVEIAEGTRIVLGFDGSEVDDWTAIIAETLDGHSFVPTYHGDRHTIWRPSEWPQQRVPKIEVRAAIDSLFERYDVVRFYADPPFWESMIDELEGEHPKKVFRWATYRVPQMHAALERYRTDVLDPDSRFSHDGHQLLETGMRNAVEMARRGSKYVLAKASETQKIDPVMAAVLAHEARGDAIAAGAQKTAAQRVTYIDFL